MGHRKVHTFIANGGTIRELTDDKITTLFKSRFQTSKTYLAPIVVSYCLSTHDRKNSVHIITKAVAPVITLKEETQKGPM